MTKKYHFSPGPVIRREPGVADIEKTLDALEDDLNKKIPGIIEYVKYISDKQGKELRAAAQGAAPHVGKYNIALQAGFKLGQEWCVFHAMVNSVSTGL